MKRTLSFICPSKSYGRLARGRSLVKLVRLGKKRNQLIVRPIEFNTAKRPFAIWARQTIAINKEELQTDLSDQEIARCTSADRFTSEIRHVERSRFVCGIAIGVSSGIVLAFIIFGLLRYRGIW